MGTSHPHVSMHSTDKLKHQICAGLHDATVGLSYGCPSLPCTLGLCAAVWLFIPSAVCSHAHGWSICWCVFCQPTVERPLDVKCLVPSGSVQQHKCALMQNVAVSPSVTSTSEDYTILMSHIQIYTSTCFLCIQYAVCCSIQQTLPQIFQEGCTVKQSFCMLRWWK